jgi:hypothetical protein
MTLLKNLENLQTENINNKIIKYLQDCNDKGFRIFFAAAVSPEGSIFICKGDSVNFQTLSKALHTIAFKLLNENEKA